MLPGVPKELFHDYDLSKNSVGEEFGDVLPATYCYRSGLTLGFLSIFVRLLYFCELH